MARDSKSVFAVVWLGTDISQVRIDLPLNIAESLEKPLVLPFHTISFPRRRAHQARKNFFCGRLVALYNISAPPDRPPKVLVVRISVHLLIGAIFRRRPLRPPTTRDITHTQSAQRYATLRHATISYDNSRVRLRLRLRLPLPLPLPLPFAVAFFLCFFLCVLPFTFLPFYLFTSLPFYLFTFYLFFPLPFLPFTFFFLLPFCTFYFFTFYLFYLLPFFYLVPFFTFYFFFTFF